MTDFASTTEVPWKHHIKNIETVEITTTTNVGSNAFNGATSLSSVTLHNTMTKIGDNAFNGCGLLTKITLPTSLTTIGASPREGSSSRIITAYYPDPTQWSSDFKTRL